MAETKKATPVAETKKVEKEEMVTIKLPREKGKDSEFVSVNERTWLVKLGVEVEVPACVAEVLRNSERMREEADEFDNSVQK